jgi:ferredoxin-NADP reductase
MKFKLLQKKAVGQDVKTFIFEPSETLNWQPGQYMHYVFNHPNPDDRGIERWFTISSPPFEGRPAITTRFTEPKGSSFKHALDNLNPGDEIEADGPKGKFVVEDPAKQYIFIAGGIGITPFRSILLQLAHDKQPINVDLMYANRDDNFIFDDEFQDITGGNPNFRIHKFVSPKKIEADDIKAAAGKLNDPEYYVSGPEPMVEAFAEMLKKMEIAEEKIHTDDFPGYEDI